MVEGEQKDTKQYRGQPKKPDLAVRQPGQLQEGLAPAFGSNKRKQTLEH